MSEYAGLDKWIQGYDDSLDNVPERCAECGNRVEDGDEICGHCAAENRDVEDAVNDR